MPANVTAMAYAGQTPWHMVGTKVDPAAIKTVEDGLKAAGLNWDVLLRQAKLYDGTNLDHLGMVTVRSDTGEPLAIVGPNTTPLQNREAFNFFTPFLDAGEAFFETAGALDDGRKVWILAKINRANAEITKGDEVAKYLLLSNSHDGTTSVRVGFTPIRVVCQNTLHAAIRDKDSQLIRVRHTRKVAQNVEAIRDTVNLANEQFEATAEKYRFLARKGINQKDVSKYVKAVFGMADDPKTRSLGILNEILTLHERRTTEEVRLQEQKDFMSSLLQQAQEQAANIAELQEKAQQMLLDAMLEKTEAGIGNDTPENRGTAWSMYNAVTEYITHIRGNGEPDKRLESLWFGQSARTNEKALEYALLMADGKPLPTEVEATA